MGVIQNIENEISRQELIESYRALKIADKRRDKLRLNDDERAYEYDDKVIEIVNKIKSNVVYITESDQTDESLLNIIKDKKVNK